MPWQKTTPMIERLNLLNLIQLYHTRLWTMTARCTRFGISRKPAIRGWDVTCKKVSRGSRRSLAFPATVHTASLQKSPLCCWRLSACIRIGDLGRSYPTWLGTALRAWMDAISS
jgi:hypothetical protein